MAIDGYQLVEYIQSSGTQYIDTGIKPSEHLNTLRIEADMQYVAAPTDSTSHFLFGTGYYNSTAANRRTIAAGYYPSGSKVKTSYFNAGNAFSTGMEVFTNSTMDADRHLYGIDQVNKKYLFDAQTQSFTGTINSNLTNPILIFCGRASGTSGAPVNYYSSARCYGFKIYDNGELIRDFVPARNGTEFGLYDMVGGSFYANAGSGSFTGGADAYSVSVNVIPEGWGYVEGVGNYVSGSVAELVARPIGRHDFSVWGDGWNYYERSEVVQGDVELTVYFEERQGVLPKGFEPVFALAINNSELGYIDTGIYSSNKVDIEAKIKNFGQAYLFGARNTNSNTSAGQLSALVEEGQTIIGYNTAQTTYANPSIAVEYNTAFVQKDGVELSLLSQMTARNIELASADFEGTQTIYMFARNNGGVLQQGTGYAILYRAKVWSNGDLVRDYVPVYEPRVDRTTIIDLVTSELYDVGIFLNGEYTLAVNSTEGGQGKIDSEVFGLIDQIRISDDVLQMIDSDRIRLKAIPEKGYVFTHWTENGSTISTEQEFWYTPTQNDTTITAHFVKLASEEQNNGYRIIALPYGAGFEAYLNQTAPDPHSNIFEGVRSATISEDIMQTTTSSIELKGNVEIGNGCPVFLYDPRGREIFCGVVRANENGILSVGEPLAITDDDFILNSTGDITNYRMDYFVQQMVEKHLNGETRVYGGFVNPMIKKKCFPFKIDYEFEILADGSMNYLANPPTFEAGVINTEETVFDLANSFVIVFKARKGKKIEYIEDIGDVEYDAMLIDIINPFAMDGLKIGTNSEELSNISIQKENTDETYNNLIVFDSSGTNFRAEYGVMQDGTIKRDVLFENLPELLTPANLKIEFSDDSLKTLKEQYLKSGTYNHKITFDVDLAKGTLRLEDFNLGRPIDFYDGGRLYKTMVTGREYTIEANHDQITSVKVTLGKTRTSLTSKMNLRK